LCFKAEHENGLLENKALLEREGTLQARVKSLWDAIQLDKRRTDLKEELNEVCTEIEQEKSERREWALHCTELDRQINELRSGPLAGTRINGRR
jgi:chromosome segregation ATPase